MGFVENAETAAATGKVTKLFKIKLSPWPPQGVSATAHFHRKCLFVIEKSQIGKTHARVANCLPNGFTSCVSLQYPFFSVLAKGWKVQAFVKHPCKYFSLISIWVENIDNQHDRYDRTTFTLIENKKFEHFVKWKEIQIIISTKAVEDRTHLVMLSKGETFQNVTCHVDC